MDLRVSSAIIKYCVLFEQEFFGTTVMERAGIEFRATGLERTLVDLHARPDLGGGWEEIWRSLESVEYFDLDLIAASNCWVIGQRRPRWAGSSSAMPTIRLRRPCVGDGKVESLTAFVLRHEALPPKLATMTVMTTTKPTPEEVRKEVTAMKSASKEILKSKESARRFLIKKGYITKSGNLTRKYGG